MANIITTIQMRLELWFCSDCEKYDVIEESGSEGNDRHGCSICGVDQQKLTVQSMEFSYMK